MARAASLRALISARQAFCGRPGRRKAWVHRFSGQLSVRFDGFGTRLFDAQQLDIAVQASSLRTSKSEQAQRDHHTGRPHG